MKKLLSLLAFVMAAAAALTAQAQTVPNPPNGTATSNFNVIVKLNAKCQITTAPTDITLTYDAFQSGDATGTTPVGVQCTGSLPYNLALNGDASAAGLTGSLAILKSGSPISTDTGTGSAIPYTVSAKIVGGQAGTCTTGSCSVTLARTLTITY